VTASDDQQFLDGIDERDLELWDQCGITDPAAIRRWVQRGYHFWGHVLDRPEHDSLYLDSNIDPSKKELPHFVRIQELKNGKVSGISPIPYCLRRDNSVAVLSVQNVVQLRLQPKFDGHYMAASMAQFISENFPFEIKEVSRSFKVSAFRDDTSHELRKPYHHFVLSFNSFGAVTVRFLEHYSGFYAWYPTEEEVGSFNTHALTKLPNNFEGFDLNDPPKPLKKQKTKKRPPLEIGLDPVSGNLILLKDGKFGPYVTDGLTNASLKSQDSVEELSLERATELLAEKRS
jgi:hypothetical protein